MSTVNIPIYRAKLDNDDLKIVGFLTKGENNSYWVEGKIIIGDSFSDFTYCYTVDPSTLAIHFPYMLDSKGKKIFASLSEDGKGGDIGISVLDRDYSYRMMFHYQRGLYMTRLDIHLPTPIDYKRVLVTGIQE